MKCIDFLYGSYLLALPENNFKCLGYRQLLRILMLPPPLESRAPFLIVSVLQSVYPMSSSDFGCILYCFHYHRIPLESVYGLNHGPTRYYKAFSQDEFEHERVDIASILGYCRFILSVFLHSMYSFILH